MKCVSLALTAMVAFAYAAPVQESWIEPGGDHEYKSLNRRKLPIPKAFRFKKDAEGRRIVDPINMFVGSTAISVFALPLGTRFYNSVLGVQEPISATQARERIEKDAAAEKAEKAKGAKRSIDVDPDLTFDETRKLFISSFVDTNFKNNPNGGKTDAAVCTGVGYKISDPSKTLDAAEVDFRASGRKYEYDCFILAGPVKFEVNNATDADFVWKAPTGATFSNGVLTVL